MSQTGLFMIPLRLCLSSLRNFIVKNEKPSYSLHKMSAIGAKNSYGKCWGVWAENIYAIDREIWMQSYNSIYHSMITFCFVIHPAVNLNKQIWHYRLSSSLSPFLITLPRCTKMICCIQSCLCCSGNAEPKRPVRVVFWRFFQCLN